MPFIWWSCFRNIIEIASVAILQGCASCFLLWIKDWLL